MRPYFAFGSNLYRARLQARVGPVQVQGLARLPGYSHGFTKLGRDGSGKGNLEQAASAHVFGVVYALDADQLDLLVGFETGYRRRHVEVDLDGAWIRATTFVALRSVHGLVPSQEYLDFYRRGGQEHGLPADYLAAILGQF